jgi:GH18 family chitinase
MSLSISGQVTFSMIYRCRACFSRLIPAVALLAAVMTTPATLGVELMGYLPNYRMRNDTPALPSEQDPFSSYTLNTLKPQMAMLDEVRYFGITVNANGTLTTSLADEGNIQKINSLIAELPESQRPRLGITLGGDGGSANFATVAGNSALRTAFAGNINSLMNSVGAMAVDVDWEHPTNATQRANYSLLMQEIKLAVGATKKVTATMSPEIYMPHSAFEGANAIDGVSLMTYDIGWWGNDPQNPATGEHSLQEYAEDAVDAWTLPPGSPVPNDRDWVYGPTWGNNTSAGLLGVGLPFYGRDISSGAAFTYAELRNGTWATTDNNYYTKNGQTVWLPGPDLVEDRVEFANERGLQNIIIWELAQDLAPTNPNSLLRRAFEKNESFAAVLGDYDGSGSVGPEDYNLWKSSYGSTSGDMRADGNEDGVIDTADYTFWRNHLVTENLGAGSASSTAVPEPSASVLTTVLIVLKSLLRRRRGMGN